MEEIKKAQEEQEKSICFEIIKDQQQTIRTQAIVFSIATAVIVVSMLLFLNGYAFETVTVDAESGNAIYQNSLEGDNTVNGKN